MHTISDKKLLMLKPEEIEISNKLPRKFFDEYELNLLAESIRSSGIIQPLSVRKRADGRYELIAGQRRLKAAQTAGVRRVPCVLHKTDEPTAILYSVIENLQKSNLSFFEEAAALKMLVTEYNMSQTEVSARIGISQSGLAAKLRLLNLTVEIRQRIVDANLSERQAKALLRIPENMQNEALDCIIAQGMTPKQTEEFVTEMLKPKAEAEKTEPSVPVRKFAMGDMRLFTNSLSKLVDTLQSAGINANTRKYETERYVEYKVRIKKEPQIESATQLKLC